MDIGGKDFTVVLFAYYDFLKNTVVIEDEYILKEKQNSEKIKKAILYLTHFTLAKYKKQTTQYKLFYCTKDLKI
jgi:hypothetical protein